MPNLSPAQLLSEVEDLLRTMPPRATIRHETDENYAWFGRAAALVTAWNSAKGIAMDLLIRSVQSRSAPEAGPAMSSIQILLQQARHDLRLNSVGPLSVLVEKGAVFDYFDELRKVIEGVTTDLLFVDPYLDSEFCSRYLTHVRVGVSVRLLTSERLGMLLPAVALLRQQNGLSIEVRSSRALHDRFLFVDASACYQSGASFKDGARKSPTTLTQITDAFAAIQATYEAIWSTATPQS